MSHSVLVEGDFTSLGAPARAQQSRPYRQFRHLPRLLPGVQNAPDRRDWGLS